MNFDPNAASVASGIFGLPFSLAESRFIVIPVPFDATTSYRHGTSNGPAAVLEASYQVDLYDLDFGRPYEQGVYLLPTTHATPRKIATLNSQARRLAAPIIKAGGEIDKKPKLKKALAEVNRRSAAMNALVEQTTREFLAKGKTPVVLGGDHSTPFGAIAAYAEKFPGLGVLHIDAHADLRPAYEGFEWSHASIMHNVVYKIGASKGLASLVQVGIRDFSEEEFQITRRPKQLGETAIHTFFDAQLQEKKLAGTPWKTLCAEIVSKLPPLVYISLDIDGFDPALCPDTGTPVPGGLSLNELLELLRSLIRMKRRIVGFDLNEVAPSPLTKSADWGKDWNANVGARVLYKLIGAASNS